MATNFEFQEWSLYVGLTVFLKYNPRIKCMCKWDVTIVTWGQFHQPFGTKHKCAGSRSSAPVGAIQFQQQHYAQLHHYAQLENMLNFYAVCPM
jgi:hypothetical protein